MSALEEYEKLASGKGPDVDPDDIFDYADAAIESLKCCGNCWHYDDGGYDRPTCDVDGRTVASDDHCRFFTPSRWTECK